MASALVGTHGAAVKISSGNSFCYLTATTSHYLFLSVPNSKIPLSKRTLHIASAKRFSSREGRFDGKNRKGSVSTKEDVEEKKVEQNRMDNIERAFEDIEFGGYGDDSLGDYTEEEKEILRNLPGQEPDFWEGEQWDNLGFFVRYLWVFGIFFALVASVIAAATYNDGASDFKKTPAYQESNQTREFLLDEPEGSASDNVFESNPTEVEPSLE